MPGFAMGTITLQISNIQLSAVSIEADNTVLATDKNIYIPTTTQKMPRKMPLTSCVVWRFLSW